MLLNSCNKFNIFMSCSCEKVIMDDFWNVNEWNISFFPQTWSQSFPQGFGRNGPHLWNEQQVQSTWQTWDFSNGVADAIPFTWGTTRFKKCIIIWCKMPGCWQYRGKQWTYVAELHHSNFSQFTDTTVSCFRLEEKLSQGHLLTPEQLPHLDEECKRLALQKG